MITSSAKDGSFCFAEHAENNKLHLSLASGNDRCGGTPVNLQLSYEDTERMVDNLNRVFEKMKSIREAQLEQIRKENH